MGQGDKEKPNFCTITYCTRKVNPVQTLRVGTRIELSRTKREVIERSLPGRHPSVS